jgi:Holliday junction resolvase
MDPLLCGDACPDPSRHSENKLVPDLFAWKPGYLLVIEMKPSFSVQDEQKLISLLTTRRNHLHLALKTFAKDRSMPFLENPDLLKIVPCLAFKNGARFKIQSDFCYFLIESLESVLTHRTPECVVPDELLKQPKNTLEN